jgi:hypothetical protein
VFGWRSELEESVRAHTYTREGVHYVHVSTRAAARADARAPGGPPAPRARTARRRVPPYPMKSGASTSVIVLSSFTSTCSDGPAVSLNGSPTVSPTTDAACVGEPFSVTEPSGSFM